MNFDDFTYEENGRKYVKPQVSLNEQNAFIDNLRNMQAQNTNKIRQDTYNLGSALPSNKGGLMGSTSYFQSRYQTPQTEALTSNLRATAQSQALETLMNNELNKMKKVYQDAYNDYLRAKEDADETAAKKQSDSMSQYLEKLIGTSMPTGDDEIYSVEPDDDAVVSDDETTSEESNGRVSSSNVVQGAYEAASGENQFLNWLFRQNK